MTTRRLYSVSPGGDIPRNESQATSAVRMSVVVPCYNRSEVIARALQSVLAQTRAADEIVVVDDGSTDDTADVVAGFRAQGVALIRGVFNRGANWARNRGIEAATGELICFLDSDDEFLSNKLSRVESYFGQRPDTDLLLDSFRERRRGRERQRLNPIIDSREDFRTAVFAGSVNKVTSAISARRQVLLDSGMFDETLKRRQDMDVLLKVSRRHLCRSIDEILWVKNHSADGISANRHNFLESLVAICDQHPECLQAEAYRVGVDRDLMRHIVELIEAGEFRVAWRDLQGIRTAQRFRVPSLNLWLWGIRLLVKRLVRRR